MNIKLIITDIDGTLTGKSHEVNDRTKQVIRLAQQKGVTVAAATGRMLDSAMKYVRELDIHGPVISYNGALVADSITGEIIYERTLPVALAREVLQFADREGVYCQYYDRRAYYMREHCRESDVYDRSSGIKGVPVGGDLAGSLEFEPLKLLLINDSVEKIDQVYKNACKVFAGRLEVVKSTSVYLDFMHLDANKAIAAAILAERMGISMEHVMTIGDGLNDISMLRQAGIGVAMGNAHQLVKDAADYVTANQDECGAAKAVEKFVLKEQ